MRALALDLGFEFDPVWALMMPLEKVLAYLERRPADLTDGDRDLIGRLALPLDAASTAAQKYKSRPCALLNDQVTMDFQATVTLCCSVFDVTRYGIGNYLDLPIKEIQRRRMAHSQCGPCMERGLHVYGTYGAPAEFDAIAKGVAQRSYAAAASLSSGTPVGPSPLKQAIKDVLPSPVLRTLRRFWPAR
jgi:hypothetical protein